MTANNPVRRRGRRERGVRQELQICRLVWGGGPGQAGPGQTGVKNSLVWARSGVLDWLQHNTLPALTAMQSSSVTQEMANLLARARAGSIYTHTASRLDYTLCENS